MTYSAIDGLTQHWTTTDPGITGNLTLAARVRLDDYTVTPNQTLIGCFGVSNNRVFWMNLRVGGGLAFNFSTAGTAWDQEVILTPGTAFVDGTGYWLRAKRLGTSVELFSAADADDLPTSWTSLGTGTVSASDIFSGTATLSIGDLISEGNGAPGRFYQAYVWDGDADSGGTLVRQFNANRRGQPSSILARTGETWTAQNGCFVEGVTTYGPPSFEGKAAA